MYDDTNKNVKKPPVGEKLNKPAIITLKNMELKNKTYNEKIEVYKNVCQKRTDAGEPCEFISYDEETKVLKFKVEHFTKYNFDDDEEESQEPSVVQD